MDLLGTKECVYLTQVTQSLQNIVFVGGKGGVGKTAVSQSLARRLSFENKSVLWTTFEDPHLPRSKWIEKNKNLHWLNIGVTESFEEYVALKLKIGSRLTHLFLHNPFIRSLAKAAPGLHELVLLGKVWHERTHYDHVIVDLPSTGYGVALFQVTLGFSKLFRGSPVQQEADEMLSTFGDSTACGHWILSLPEEMPLREALDLKDHLFKLFPKNPAHMICNRIFPQPAENRDLSPSIGTPQDWTDPLAIDLEDAAIKRACLEKVNLKIWEEAQIQFDRLPWISPELNLEVQLEQELKL